MEKKSMVSVKDMALIGLFAGLIAICSWISIPFTVPITLQTFAVLTAVGLLGRKNGVLSVLIYILLGAVGLPVFAGFNGGLGTLLGTTGGYIIGFIFTALLAGTILKHYGKSYLSLLIAMVMGVLVCYIFGTIWFVLVYTKANGSVPFITVLGWCVFPFLIPDGIKIILSSILVKRLDHVVNRRI